MKLLENCWSELLLLDVLYKQLEHTDTHRLLMVSLTHTQTKLWFHEYACSLVKPASVLLAKLNGLDQWTWSDVTSLLFISLASLLGHWIKYQLDLAGVKIEWVSAWVDLYTAHYKQKVTSVLQSRQTEMSLNVTWTARIQCQVVTV